MENQNEILEIDNLKRIAKECFCDLNIDGSITVDNINGSITLTIPKDKTRELKKFSTGDWSLEYKVADGEFKSLIRGPWDTISEVTI